MKAERLRIAKHKVARSALARRAEPTEPLPLAPARGPPTSRRRVADCKAEFSRDKGHGFRNDLVVPASPPDGGPATPPRPEVLLAEVVASCEAAGAADCNPSNFLTYEGALCVARAEGFAEGLRPWQAGMHLDPRQGPCVSDGAEH